MKFCHFLLFLKFSENCGIFLTFIKRLSRINFQAIFSKRDWQFFLDWFALTRTDFWIVWIGSKWIPIRNFRQGLVPIANEFDFLYYHLDFKFIPLVKLNKDFSWKWTHFSSFLRTEETLFRRNDSHFHYTERRHCKSSCAALTKRSGWCRCLKARRLDANPFESKWVEHVYITFQRCDVGNKHLPVVVSSGWL